MVYVLNPVFSKLLLSLTSKTLNILAIIFFTLFMIDVIISFKITWKFKKVSENTSIDSKIDNTEKITKYVKEQIISHRKKLEVRLVNAFPRLKVLKFKKNK